MSRLSKHIPFLHPADFWISHSDQAAVDSENPWHINYVFRYQFLIFFPGSQITARGLCNYPVWIGMVWTWILRDCSFSKLLNIITLVWFWILAVERIIKMAMLHNLGTPRPCERSDFAFQGKLHVVQWYYLCFFHHVKKWQNLVISSLSLNLKHVKLAKETNVHLR